MSIGAVTNNATGSLLIQASGNISGTTVNGTENLSVHSTGGQINYSGNIIVDGSIFFNSVAPITAQNVESTYTGSLGEGEIEITATESTFSGNIISTKDSTINIVAGAGAQTAAISTTLAGSISVSALESSANNHTGALTGGSSGSVSIAAGGNTTVTGDISVNEGPILVYAGGNLNVTGNLTTAGGALSQSDVFVEAGGTLVVESISTTLGGNVDIKAQTNGGNAPFVIGTAGQTNGVNSIIRATGSGGSETTNSSVVYITNGSNTSNGGITITTASDVQAQLGSGARGGTIILNAQNGVLSLPSGNYSVAGTGTKGGGIFALMANTVAFGGTVSLDASQSTTASPFDNQVSIAASSITFASGLTLNASGNGASGGPLAQASLLPQGGLVVADNEEAGSEIISVSQAPTLTGGLSVAGGASASLTVEANGNNALVQVAGYPLIVYRRGCDATVTGCQQSWRQHYKSRHPHRNNGFDIWWLSYCHHRCLWECLKRSWW